MAKTPACKNCLETGHYKTWCPSLRREPLKRSVIKPKPKKVKLPTKKKPKARTRSYYVKQLDKVFSEYIRRSKPPVCVTCGTKDEWKRLQNGHYYSRTKIPTRWNEDNCWPQCVACNMFRGGNYTEYALFMLQTLGEGKLRDLHKLAISGEKITTPVIRQMIEDYSAKLAIMNG